MKDLLDAEDAWQLCRVVKVADHDVERSTKRLPHVFVDWSSSERFGELVPEELVLAEHEIILRGEVPEERALRHPRCGHDVVDRCLLVSPGNDQFLSQHGQLCPHCAACALSHRDRVALLHDVKGTTPRPNWHSVAFSRIVA